MNISFRHLDTSPAAIESQDERESRIRREGAVIAKAHADIKAGLGIDNDALSAWLDALDDDPNTPPP
jgi:hypothetical protein